MSGAAETVQGYREKYGPAAGTAEVQQDQVDDPIGSAHPPRRASDMRQLSSQTRRRSAQGALAVALSFATTMALALPAAAASTVPVRSIVRSQVAVSQAVGATLSIIHVCPSGSVLDRPRTRSLIARTPPGYRLLSRELWPRGMVTRWRVTAPPPVIDNPPLPQQTVACLTNVPAGATRSTAKISVTVRLWGPAPAKAELSSWHDPSATWAGSPARSTIAVRDFTSRRLVYAQAGTDSPDEAFGYGFLLGPYPAGRYAELKVYLAVTAHRR
jgi:hypothetical protein